jgi:membrane protease YdiL (CAAX protease family)
MKTRIPAPTRIASPLILAAVVLASGLPSLIADALGIDRFIVGSVQVAALILIAATVFLVPSQRHTRAAMVVLAVLGVFFHVGLNWLRSPTAGMALFTEGDLWVQLAAWQVLSTGVTAGLFVVLRFYRFTRAEMFATAGSPTASAAPIPWLGHKEAKPWTQFGRELALILTGATLLFVWLGGGYDGTTLKRLILAAPLIALLAGINAFNEEFQTRNAIIATFEPFSGGAGAALLSAFIFGSWHFTGTPGGVVGALMAGFAGWLWARSMVETRGMGVAWTLHFLQDVVIFAALVS